MESISSSPVAATDAVVAPSVPRRWPTNRPLTPVPVVVAGGGPGDFLTARWVRAAGTHRDLGRALAEAAQAVHGGLASPRPVPDPVVEEVRRQWFAAVYPAMSQRMQGVADAFGLDAARLDVDLALLGTYRLPAGCSAVLHPPARTRDGHALLARNFDFPTVRYGDIVGASVSPEDRPLGADPWVVQCFPDNGYASMTVGIMDVLGAMDGINDQGLAVALLADDESSREEAVSSRVGLSEQQVVRYLLDTCATARQARRALLFAKHYYTFVPCHFLVADAGGDAFVWEHSPRRNVESTTRPASPDEALVCTNHLLGAPARDRGDRSAEIAGASRHRFRTLQRRVRTDGPADAATVRAQLTGVAFTAPAPQTRTLWSATYDLSARSLTISFYLRDEDGVSRYAPLLRFNLLSQTRPWDSDTRPEEHR